MLTEILAYIWYIMLIIQAFLWFFLVREFNKKEKTSFPSLVYAILYLIPGVHYFISWSFIKDIQEIQIKTNAKNSIPVFKTYLWKLALPHFFLAVGLPVFSFLGVVLILFIPALGESITKFAVAVPYLSFIWLVWGFKSLFNIVHTL
jgi:hypothetical protein